MRCHSLLLALLNDTIYFTTTSQLQERLANPVTALAHRRYHYFFTRKLCMAFHMQALVVAPGGFGTCDEMFEMMTLKQTGKMQPQMPIVLLGSE